MPKRKGSAEAKQKLSQFVERVREACSSQWPEVIAQASGHSSADITTGHGPCPKCGGKDRFRLFDDDSGGGICNQCFRSKNGDGFSVIQWLTGVSFPQAVLKAAEAAGVTVPEAIAQHQWPDKHLVWIDENEHLYSLVLEVFCEQYPPLTPDAVLRFGGRPAVYRGEAQVIAFPLWGPAGTDASPIGYDIYHWQRGALPVYRKGPDGKFVRQDGPKEINTPGSEAGFANTWAVERQPSWAGRSVWKAEGITDAIALQQLLGDDAFVITTGGGAGQDPSHYLWMLKALEKTHHYIVHDCDQPGQQGATKTWGPAAAASAEFARNVLLPYAIQPDHGPDLRDWVRDGGTRERLLELAEEAMLLHAEVDIMSAIPDSRREMLDPFLIAISNEQHYSGQEGYPVRFKYWQGDYWVWKRTHWKLIPPSEWEWRMVRATQSHIDRGFAQRVEQGKAEKDETAPKISSSLVKNVMLAQRGLYGSSDKVELGQWVDGNLRKNRQILSFANGLLDLDRWLEDGTTDLMDFDPRWFSAVTFGYNYDPDATCPQWMEFLETSVPDQEVRLLLQEWAGYCMVFDHRYEKMLLIEGSGANGKSVFLSGMMALLGLANCSTVGIDAFSRQFDLWNTVGKLVNIIDDVEKVDSVAEGRLKSFITGQPIYFDRKNQPGVTTSPTARMMVAANERPRLGDKSDGIWRRLMIAPFSVTIPHHKRRLGMNDHKWWEASGELPGIANWALEGLARLRAQKGFIEPQVSLDALRDYRETNNPVTVFLADHIVEDPAGRVPCNDLYELYVGWCRDDGLRPLSHLSFQKQLQAVFPKVERKRLRESVIQDDGSEVSIRKYFYTGILVEL